jgi:catechol 2,3-dioxygenase-like lactoylglutathione lyase family enzyme
VTAPAFAVTGVDFVSVPTKDLAAARVFYGGVLGLPCSTVYERVPGADHRYAPRVPET